ncbi:Ribonuclease R [Chlamydiales bacterium SCGC AB-751-O23]|jgi:ribonuclease R|nr:Ribonuclease R [Chlamydiales bacterium SCGC AB-751-O23]
MKRNPSKKDPKTSFMKKLLKLLKKRDYEPLNLNGLRDRLNVSHTQLEVFDSAIKELLINEKIEVNKRHFRLVRETKARKEDYPVVKGELFTNPKGFGFLHPSDPGFEENVFIPKSQINGGINGDIVNIEVTKTNSSKGPEGRVLEILDRKTQMIVATVTEILPQKRFMAFSSALGLSHPILIEAEKNLEIGDRVFAKVSKWHEKNSPTIAQVEEELGNISDPKIDTLCSCKEHVIRTDFSQSLKKELKNLSPQVSSEEMEGRLDLRGETTLTIDPDTAKDFDDAITITKDKKGSFNLAVHIADVSHYVQEGTAVDQEAALRGNSTYFPDQCIPMLPFELSNELCSLKPEVNRLTLSVLMNISSTGDLENYKIVRSVIRSNKRFTYKEALNVLEGEETSPYLEELKLMVELCKLLKQKRKERGSIEFSLPEAKLYVDKDGNPQKVEMIEYDITHQMIEEFMLKANEVIAKHLTKEEMPLPYRVHEEPKTDSMQDFSSMASLFGHSLSHVPTPEELQKMFEELKKTPETARLLSISFIKSMKLANYSTENAGHFGLCLEHYCHFTSPIRRYSDLIVHRLLFTDKPNPELDYRQLAENCSLKERQSAKAESQVNRLKKVRLLKELQEKHPHQTYEATITSVKPQGIAFETDAFLLEGFVHISQVGKDYLEYSKESQSLTGARSQTQYIMGQKIEVMLLEVDLIHSETRWSICSVNSGKPIQKAPIKKARKPKSGKRVFTGPKKNRGKKRKKS